jgi:hypothetical protein
MGDLDKQKEQATVADTDSPSKGINDTSKEKRLVYLGALVCLVIVLVLIVGLSFGLTKKNDDNDRDVPVPTPISPTNAPQPMVRI